MEDVLSGDFQRILSAEGYPQSEDYYIAAVFALVLPIARFILDRSVFEVFGQWLVFGRASTHKPPRKKHVHDQEKKFAKFKESSWKLFYYLSLFACAVAMVYEEPWIRRTNWFWEDGWPNQTMKFQLKLYYTCQMGFYVYSIAALLFWETRRKDFGVMLTHHIATLALMSISYVTGNFRVGTAVLMLHDASDVLLETAKLFKYCDNELFASIFFVLFVLSWILLRLIYYPFWLIRSTSVELARAHNLEDFKVQYYFFNTLLITLFVIHWYWWLLIFRMLRRQIASKGRVGDDVRSDSDDD